MQNSPIVYFNGQYLSEDRVFISPNDRGFTFADGTYEVLRTYQGKLLFADEHITRLKYSLSQLKIQEPDLGCFKDIFYKLLESNGLNDKLGLIYIQITRGVYKRMHAFPDEQVNPTIFIRAREFTPMTSEIKNGVKAITYEDFRWTRCDIKSISLLPNILSSQIAKDNQAYEAIFYRNGIVTEGAHTNVFGIKDGIVYTHPHSNFILAGVSRDVIVKLCMKHGIPIKEVGYPYDKFHELDEIFLAGTSTEVMPVVKLDDFEISKGQPGPITRKIQNIFDQEVNARISNQ